MSEEVIRIPDGTPQGQPSGPKTVEEWLPLVYGELRKLAAHKMQAEPPGQTLQPTALVHEAWLRLAGNDGQAQFQNRAHFFGAAAEAMRRILIERARARLTAKHGKGMKRLDGEELGIASPIADDCNGWAEALPQAGSDFN